MDEATAYHEAGHAVAALALDRPVTRVSILARRDTLGTCAFGKAVFRPSEDWVERETMISLAGLAAEARHTGEYDHDLALPAQPIPALQPMRQLAALDPGSDAAHLLRTQLLRARNRVWHGLHRARGAIATVA